MSKFLTKLTSLIEVKKIIALLVISVFCILSAKEVVSTEQFTTVAIMIVSFYFGQSTVKGTVKKIEDANLKNYTLFTEDIQNEVQDQVEVSKEAISMNEKKLQEQKVESSSEQSMPTITVASEQIKIKKNLRTRVLELFEEGLLPEEIAKTLDVSITEVQLIIDIFSL